MTLVHVNMSVGDVTMAAGPLARLRASGPVATPLGPAGLAARLGQQILCCQPYGSGRWPYWMPTSSSRSAVVTGPALPSAISQSPEALRTRPTGVMTAAVPQANTSVSSPDAQ